MWIHTKDRLVNTRHLTEIKVTSSKTQNGYVHEVTACPSRKENLTTCLFQHESKDRVEIMLKKIAKAIRDGDKEFVV